MKSRSTRILGLPLGAMLLLPTAGYAQSAAPAEAGASQQTIADIIVTARRKSENLQDVPVAITVATQEDLTQKNIQAIGDLQHSVPSLTMTGPYRNTPIVSIRGQGGFSPGGIPSVILYMNEVPLPTSAQAGSPGGALGANGLFFDLENVQVLKGPQGTLFGRNTTGGAILIQSKRPTNDFGGHLSVTAGNYGDREFDAAINLPLSEDILFRVAANGQKRDGFTKAQSTPSHPNGLDLDDTNHFATRGSLLVRSGAFENLLIGEYLKYDHNGVSAILKAASPNPAHPVNLFFPVIQSLVQAQNARGVRDVGALSADMSGFLRRWSVTNITSYELTDEITLRNVAAFSRARYAQTIDGDGTFLPIFDPIQSQDIPYVTRQFSEEIQLQGKSFDDRFDWVAGFFYLKQPKEDNFTRHTNVTLGRRRTIGFQQFESSKALFAQGDFDLGATLEGLSLTAGFRYTWETIGRASSDVLATGACTSPFSGANCTLKNSGNFDAPTWTVGLNYKASRNSLIYIVSRRGFRSGGFNLEGDTPAADQVYNPETVTDVEIGTKNTWRTGDVTLMLNVAAYRQWYKDIQLSQTGTSAVTGGPLTIVKNAGEARINGLEVETNARFGRYLALNGHLDLIDYKYTKLNPSVIRPVLVTNTPSPKYGIGATVTLPVPEELGEISFNVGWDWQDKTLIANIVDPFNSQGSYGLLTLGANWRNIASRPIDLSFFMTNATNKTYAIGGLPLSNSLGVSSITYGAPRMWGFRLGYRFGDEAN